MGLSLEFYAGDAAMIGADFTAIEFDGLRDGTRARAYADFSLHLSPTDLDEHDAEDTRPVVTAGPGGLEYTFRHLEGMPEEDQATGAPSARGVQQDGRP